MLILKRNTKDLNDEKVLRFKVDPNEETEFKLDFKDLFKQSVSESLFTIKSNTTLDFLNICKEEVLHHPTQEELEVLYRYIHGVKISPNDMNSIIDLFSQVWDNKKPFQDITSVFYLSEDMRELESNLKIFNNYDNPVRIQSIWDFYKFKVSELYFPVRNHLLNSYMYKAKVYKTDDPLEFGINMISGVLDTSLMFGDKIYQVKIKED